MSGTYLYCQNPECREYLGSLGGDSCPHCGWSSGQQEREIPEDEDGVKGGYVESFCTKDADGS